MIFTRFNARFGLYLLLDWFWSPGRNYPYSADKPVMTWSCGDQETTRRPQPRLAPPPPGRAALPISKLTLYLAVKLPCGSQPTQHWLGSGGDRVCGIDARLRPVMTGITRPLWSNWMWKQKSWLEMWSWGLYSHSPTSITAPPSPGYQNYKNYTKLTKQNETKIYCPGNRSSTTSLFIQHLG